MHRREVGSRGPRQLCTLQTATLSCKACGGGGCPRSCDPAGKAHSGRPQWTGLGQLNSDKKGRYLTSSQYFQDQPVSSAFVGFLHFNRSRSFWKQWLCTHLAAIWATTNPPPLPPRGEQASGHSKQSYVKLILTDAVGFSLSKEAGSWHGILNSLNFTANIWPQGQLWSGLVKDFGEKW